MGRPGTRPAMSNAVKEQPVGKHQPEPRSVGMVEVRVRKTGDAGQALADAVLAVGEAAQRYGQHARRSRRKQ